MANTLLTPKVYANVMLKLLKNQLVMGKLVTTEFKNEFKKIGNTVYVKRPPEFVIRDGAVAQVQAVVEGEVPVVINKQKGIDIQFTSLEDTLTVDQLLKSAIMNAEAAQIAQQIDSDLMSLVLGFPSWVGIPGQTIQDASAFFAGPQKLDELGVPQADRAGVLAPADYWKLAATFTGLYAQREVADTALERGKIPLLGNVQPYMTQSIINLSTGTRVAAAGLVNGAAQNVLYTAVNTTYYQNLIADGYAAGATFKAGEVFTIAGVSPVNPRTKAVLPYLAQFTLLVDATADGAGNVTFQIVNPMIVGGAFATVNAAPADNAAITFLGAPSTAFPQSAIFHKSALTLVFAKLTDPFTGQASFATDPETGVTIRYWRTSDGTNDTHLHRWDVLYGVKNLDPRLGTRISGHA